jgi:hypothetical protein
MLSSTPVVSSLGGRRSSLADLARDGPGALVAPLGVAVSADALSSQDCGRRAAMIADC